MHNSDLKKWCLPHSGSNLVVTTKTQMAVIEYRRDCCTCTVALILQHTRLHSHSTRYVMPGCCACLIRMDMTDLKQVYMFNFQEYLFHMSLDPHQ